MKLRLGFHVNPNKAKALPVLIIRYPGTFSDSAVQSMIQRYPWVNWVVELVKE